MVKMKEESIERVTDSIKLFDVMMGVNMKMRIYAIKSTYWDLSQNTVLP